MTNRISRRALGCALLATTAISTPAFAQEYFPPAAPPVRETVDQNGVDLARGSLVSRSHSVSIGGPGNLGLSWSRTITSTGAFRDSTAIYVSASGSMYTVTVGNHSETFTQSGSNFISDQKTGATLTVSGSTYTYTSRDGTVIVMTPWGAQKKQYGGIARASTVTYPTGEKLTFNWETITGICIPKFQDPCFLQTDGQRLASVEATHGYKLDFNYETDAPTDIDDTTAWMSIVKVTALNMSVDPASQTWPSLSPSGTAASGNVWFTDSLNQTTKYAYTSNLLMSVQRPGAASPNETITYTGGLVSKVVKDGVTTNYSYADLSGVRSTTINDAAAGDRVVKTNLTTYLVASDQDEAGKTTSYLYDANGLLTTVTAPEGNYATFVYDQRGNLKKTTLTPKSGSPLSPIVTQASYPASDATETWRCATGTPAVTCNKPVTTTDARSNVTDYVWDSTTGALTKATLPAPATGGVRPETRYSYGSTYAQYLTGGSLVNFATPVTRLTGISQCQTTASCTGAADEAKSVITNGTANALPVSVASGNGTGTLTATTAFTYDLFGNQLTVDGPLSGTADTTRTRYDLDRQVVGVVGPDPDGAGTLKNRAQRLTYNADGQVTKAEVGTVNSQSDADWAAFAPLETVDVTYDANGRPVTQKLSSGATAYALTQASYDSLGRVDCSAVRMNTATYGSLPASACTLGTAGSFGSDRITRMAYDADSRPTKATVAYGTADAADERTLTYSDNGQVASLKDAENNLTTIEYDGVDRVTKIRYPSPSKGAGTSSTTDYEQPTYDANGNVTAFRNRANQTTNFTYDKLNRVTLKDLPGTEPDVTYGYDNLNRPTSASQTGNALSFTYDALSRNLTQAGPQGTVSAQWDLAGRRTRLTHADGYYIDYDYLVTGETSKVRENGATSGIGVLGTYLYDNLGNRTKLTLGNGVSSTYGYDPVSRLSSLALDFTGTTNDLTLTYSYNPASQIVSTTRSNDLYAWTGHYNQNTSTTVNGRNQIVTKGGTAFSYDANGNLTNDGVTTYTFDSQNQLKTTSGTTPPTLTYDPAGRLWEVAAGTGATRYAYEGVDALTQQDTSGALWRRYIHGPGADEELVQYDGVGAATRKFLSADERGSIVAMSDDGGNVIAINRYDEYGVPQSGNAGAFQYTGQMPLVGQYNYKARLYRQNEGVFAQSDPIGYTDSANLYAYVLDDPVNLADPMGLAPVVIYAPWGYLICNDTQCVAYMAPPNTIVVVAERPCGATLCSRGGEPRPGTGPRNGRPAVGGGSTRSSPKRAVSACQAALRRPGYVEIKYAQASLLALLGVTGAEGTFRNRHTGDTGHFFSFGFGAGTLDVSVGGGVGLYKSLASFVGFSDNVTYSRSFKGFADATTTSSFSVDGGDYIGQSLGASFGASLPKIPSFGGSTTETELFSCKLGR